MAREVIVIGGGLSGLISAYQLLREPGLSVTVLEAESTPGGQARAFDIDGRTVEHGSHAFFGYYETILRVIDELRADGELAAGMPGLLRVGGWTLVDAYARRAYLTQTEWLPRLLKIVPSILKVPWFSFTDKLRAMWASFRLLSTPLSQFGELDKYTSFEWGTKIGYSPIGAWTWNSASLGLTNLFVQEQSAAIFCGKHKVLLGTDQGLSYQLPAGSLSELLPVPLARAVKKRGGRVLLGARVEKIGRGPGDARTRVDYTIGGERRTAEADHVICALQPRHAAPLLPWVKAAWTSLPPTSPVITMVVGLSGRVTESPDGRELGMSRETWAFSVVTDLSRFWPEYAGERSVLRVEVGHADDLPHGVDCPDDVLLDLVRHDLGRLYPETKAMRIEWHKVHRETEQLYVSWTRGHFARKPDAHTRDVGQGVYLAGDWTTKGTIGMEAAANSAIEAANWVLRREGREVIAFKDVPLD